jgi:segregation and condensation protein A
MLEFISPRTGEGIPYMNEQRDQAPKLPMAGQEEPEGEGYRVQVGQFEGPLDLLLHLVRVNEIDIADIPIVEITEQYNEHLEMMRELNLEIAGEYIVMAATLMQIKSKMLLPPDPTLGEDEEAEDPRAALAQQLLEYQRFKQAAETLQAIDSRRKLIWSRDSIPEEFEGEELLAADLFDLLKSFRELLGRLGEDARLEIMRDTVSIAEKITWLTDLLEARSSVELLTLLEDLPSRLERIATFLAVLEMIRLHLATAFQRKMFGEIRLTACVDGGVQEQPPKEDE